MEINTAKELIKCSDKILIFTGAGMSQESGIPTFRDLNGIWKKYNPLIWATKSGLLFNFIFRRRKFATFIVNVSESIALATPHIGHFAICSLQKHKKTFLLTQNIDNLHQEAGSINVNEIHGNIYEITRNGKIIKCLKKQDFLKIILQLKTSYGRKNIREHLKPIINFYNSTRPNVVLFNEPINRKCYDQALSFAISCDCLIVIGTSLNVYPAAEIINVVNRDKTINIGYDPIPNAININGNASEILDQLIN